MAKQRDSKLEGTVNNLIFYNLRGKYCMRTRPDYVRRTRASINSGFNFGRASRISRQIRQLIESINPSKSDVQVSYRFTGALNKFISWLEKKNAASLTLPDRLPFIQGFQFNDQSDLTAISAIRVSVRSTGPELTEVSLAPFIPSQSLHAPSNTKSILFKMILTATSLADVKTALIGTAEIEIPYGNDIFLPPVIIVQSAPKPGDLATITMAVQYMVNKNGDVELLNNKKKLPCGVLWGHVFSEEGIGKR